MKEIYIKKLILEKVRNLEYKEIPLSGENCKTSDYYRKEWKRKNHDTGCVSSYSGFAGFDRQSAPK